MLEIPTRDKWGGAVKTEKKCACGIERYRKGTRRELKRARKPGEETEGLDSSVHKVCHALSLEL